MWAPDRMQAIERMQRALGEFVISGQGVKTTIEFHQRVLSNPVFREGNFATDFLERHMSQ